MKQSDRRQKLLERVHNQQSFYDISKELPAYEHNQLFTVPLSQL